MCVMRESFPIAACDGYPIAVHRWRRAQPIKGIVQISHGMGEHSRRYDELAAILAKLGFAVYANDHRGHGMTLRSEKETGDLGPRGFGTTLDDMLSLTAFAKRDYPRAPVALMGYSMGSYAAQAYAQDHSREIVGMVLSGGSALDLRAAELGRDGWRFCSNNRTFSEGDGFDWLSRDGAVVGAYMDDPLCGFVPTPASQRSLIDAGGVLADRSRLKQIRSDLPILALSGEHDPVNGFLQHFYPMIERFSKAGLCEVTSRVYLGARHEIFHEINRDEVISDLLDWLDHVFAAFPMQVLLQHPSGVATLH